MQLIDKHTTVISDACVDAYIHGMFCYCKGQAQSASRLHKALSMAHHQGGQAVNQGQSYTTLVVVACTADRSQLVLQLDTYKVSDSKTLQRNRLSRSSE